MPDVSSANDIVRHCRISEVAHALTGVQPRRTTSTTYRMAAVWRRGDSPDSVALDDSLNSFHDFVDESRGGVLALILKVQGGTRRDALRWLADFIGVPFDEQAFSPTERAEWAEEQRQLERDLPDARYWRRAAIALAEETLDREKHKCFDPTPEPEPVDDLSQPISEDYQSLRILTAMIDRLENAGDVALVTEYREWRKDQPFTTAALIQAAKMHEHIEVKTLCTTLDLSARAAVAYLRGAK